MELGGHSLFFKGTVSSDSSQLNEGCTRLNAGKINIFYNIL
jgi:hypothetical protein